MHRFYLAPAVVAGLGALSVSAFAFAQDAPTVSAPTPAPATPAAANPALATPVPPSAPPVPAPPTVTGVPAPPTAAPQATFAFPSTFPGFGGFSSAAESRLAPSDPTAILNAFGAAAFVRRVVVSPSVTATYDSNVARGGQFVATEQGLRSADDEIISPAVTLDLNQPLGRGAAFLSGSAGYNFYVRDTILDREFVGLTGGYTAQLGGCRGTASAGYNRSQNELTDVLRGSVKDTYSLETVGGSVGCGGGLGFAPVASVSESWSQNDGAALSSSDLRIFSASVGLAYQTPTNGTVSLFGQYQTTDFPNRTLITGLDATHDGYTLYGAGIKYSRNLGARIQGTVSAGYTIVNTGGSSNDFKGFTYSASVSYRASSRLSFLAQVDRQVTPSNVLDASYQVSNQELVQATYTHGSRWSFSLGASEQVSDQNGAGLISVFDLTSYTDDSIFASATYSLRRINFSLLISNDRRTTNQSLLDYSDTRASFTAATSF